MEITSATATAPGALPVLGHALSLLRDPFGFLARLPDYGDLVLIRVGPSAAVVVCDPELTRQVLLDDRTFDKGGPLFDRYREALGDEIVTCPYSDHRRQRRLLQPVFHPARLTGYARVMTRQIGEVTGSWRDGGVIDVLAEMQAITARTAVVTLFSDAIADTAVARTLRDFAAIQKGIYRRMLVPSPLNKLFIREAVRYRRARARVQRTAGAVIDEYRSNGTDRGDVLSVLVASRDQEGRQLSDSEVNSQVMSFFLASAETTASLLAWALLLLARHPGIEEQLHAEVDTVVNGTVTVDDLPRLPLTGRIVTETLRLYPPGWLLTRVATSDTRLGGHAIPAGTNLVYSPYLIHHRSDVFPDPWHFDPGRWDSERARPPRSALIPFGSGPRKCMGDTFAITEAALALAAIASRWRLEHIPGPRVRPARDIVLNPRGLRMRITSRRTGQPGREDGASRVGTRSS
jgi:cytochrome P450